MTSHRHYKRIEIKQYVAFLSVLGTMNARVFGAGDDGRETLVLAHGYGCSRFVWDDVVPELAGKFRVVVFDWSFSGAVEDDSSPAGGDGGGYSERCCSYYDFANELVALMDELGLRGAAFVGHSMAGMIGCIASVSRPDLFSHLVLVGASPRSGSSHSHVLYLLLFIRLLLV